MKRFYSIPLLISLCIMCTSFVSSPVNQISSTNFNITFKDTKVSYNNHVGDDWFYYANINSIKLYEGDNIRVRLNQNQKLEIKCYLEEANEKHVDKSTKIFSISYDKLLKSKNDVVKIPVSIKESNGRYAGNTAQMNFYFEVN